MSRRSTNVPYLLRKADVVPFSAENEDVAMALNMSCISAVPVLWCVATTRKTEDAEPDFGGVLKVPPSTDDARRSSAAIRATSSTFDDVRSASASR